MKFDKFLAVASLVFGCMLMFGATVVAAGGPSAPVVAAVVAPPVTPAGASASLPPQRVADCVVFSLLDDRCTKQWYTCRRGGSQVSACLDEWETCCTLRGQGARSRLGSAQPVTTNNR
jgi:hypothetical protein